MTRKELLILKTAGTFNSKKHNDSKTAAIMFGGAFGLPALNKNWGYREAIDKVFNKSYLNVRPSGRLEGPLKNLGHNGEILQQLMSLYVNMSLKNKHKKALEEIPKKAPFYLRRWGAIPVAAAGIGGALAGRSIAGKKHRALGSTLGGIAGGGGALAALIALRGRKAKALVKKLYGIPWWKI